MTTNAKLSGPIKREKFRRMLVLITAFIGLACQSAFAQGIGSFVYEGRLTTAGSPVAGPVSLRLRFFHSNDSTTAPVLTITKGLESVPLAEGVFQVHLELAPADYNEVFSGVAQPVWLDVTDLTHAPTAPYPLQEISAVPYAARVPVDNQTVSFNSAGLLSVGPASAPSAGQFLTKDANGNLVWAVPTGSGSVLQGQTVASSAPGSGQVLEFNGSQWVPTALSASGNIVSSLAATAPLAVTGPNGTPTISAAQASSVSAGFLSASDWLNFSGKVNRSGDSMSGNLDMGSSLIRHVATPSLGTDAANKSYVDALSLQALSASGSVPLSGTWAVGGKDITGVGNLGISAAKTLGLGVFDSSSEPTLVAGLSTNDKGKTWFNVTTNQVKYWDGALAQAVGAAGSGLTSLDGVTASAQTLGVSAGGSALTWATSGSTHTLDLPLASINGVGAGLLSNSDYSSFANKLSGVSAGTGLSASSASGSVTISLANAGTAGSYTKVTTNAQGQVTSGASLSAADIPALNVSALTSGTLPTSLGGTGLGTAPGAGQLLIGNGAGYTLGSLVTGATQGVTVAAGAGTITLDTAQDIRPSATPVFTGLEISGVTSTLLKTNSSGLITSATATDLIAGLGYTPVNKAGDTLSGGLNLSSLNLGGAFTARGINAPALSTAGTGVIYFDSGAGQFKISQNGLAYAPLATGGSVTSISAGSGLVGGPITGAGTLSLATVGTAGSYAKVITDTYGRVVGATTLASSDLPPVNAAGIVGVLPVANGGTGSSSGTAGGVPYYSSNASLATSGVLSAGGVVLGGGVGGAPTTATIGSGQLLIGTGGTPVSASLSAVGNNGVVVTSGSGTIGLATVQDIRSTAAPTFGGLNVPLIVSPNTLELDGAPSVVNGDGTDIGADITLGAGNLYSPSGTLTLSAGQVSSSYYGGTWAGPKVILQGVQYEANTNLILRAGQQIYGSGQIQLQDSSGNNKMVVLQTGNVGIGTSNPQAQLHLDSTLPGLQLSNAGANPSNIGLATTSGQYFSNVAAGDFIFRATTGGRMQLGVSNSAGNSAPSVTMISGGNVGIGSVSPAGKLDVAGTICLNGTNCISSWPGGGTTAVTSVTAGVGLTGGSITSTGSLSLAAVGTAGSYTKVITDLYGRVVSATTLAAADIPPLAASGITSGTFNLAQIPSHSAALITSGTLSASILPSLSSTYVAVAGSTMTGSLNLPANGLVAGANQLVLANGKVGVGTTSPAQALDVNGIGNFTTAVTMNGGTVPGNAGSSNGIWMANEGLLAAATNSNVALSANMYWNGSGPNQAQNNTAAPGWAFELDAGPGLDGVQIKRLAPGASVTTSPFVINGNGNVGIGSTSPAYPLVLNASGTSSIMEIMPQIWSSTADFAELIMGDVNHYYKSTFGIGTQLNDPNGIFLTGSNVGIGTTSASSTLQVNGSVTATTINGYNLYILHGNNGTISCSQACGTAATCLSGTRRDTGAVVSCSTTPGYLGGPELACACFTY